ncbi:nuclease harbi1 [Lasius niger]|uniref:Nuclease harbi1 n=1 Tax=Lasius niger TaxID=67767 RepID=A0A0J7KN20_LASNI|nr:nuclease harbi1 [Lasius niger]
MYRQILVRDEDKDLQRILWRSNADSEISEFRLNTVTYGFACALFLAVRTLQQLAHDEDARYPKGSSVLLRGVYVDDILTEADSIEEALFPLKKWAANSQKLLENIPEEDRMRTITLTWTPQEKIHSMLGLLESGDRLILIRRTTLRGRRSYEAVDSFSSPTIRPFGMDNSSHYLEPVFLRTSPGRGHKTTKAFLVIFICLCSKAVHLDVASSYSTEAFIAAFRRFVSRRGIFAEIFSDCGTNFVEADAKLRKLFSACYTERQAIAREMADNRMQWRFNPPFGASLRWPVGSGKLSANDSFMRVVQALNDIAGDVIVWSRGDRLTVVCEKFQRIGRLPHVIGAIDGTNIPIKALKWTHASTRFYISKDKEYAITLQAVFDAELRFLNCFAGFAGSVEDRRIFRNSDLWKEVGRNRAPYFVDQDYVIGDKAYPCLPWLIPPFPNLSQLTQAQKTFNTAVASMRQIIERAFALLKGRWRRLKFLDMNRDDMIHFVILASCVLHNVCLDNERL